MARKDITDLQVCLAYQQTREYNRGRVTDLIWPEDLLVKWTGQQVKVCYRAMERAADRGYIDCGVSLRAGWLTETGKALVGE